MEIYAEISHLEDYDGLREFELSNDVIVSSEFITTLLECWDGGYLQARLRLDLPWEPEIKKGEHFGPED